MVYQLYDKLIQMIYSFDGKLLINLNNQTIIIIN